MHNNNNTGHFSINYCSFLIVSNLQVKIYQWDIYRNEWMNDLIPSSVSDIYWRSCNLLHVVGGKEDIRFSWILTSKCYSHKPSQSITFFCEKLFLAFCLYCYFLSCVTITPTIWVVSIVDICFSITHALMQWLSNESPMKIHWILALLVSELGAVSMELSWYDLFLSIY